MRVFHFSKVLFGFLLAFQHSIADDGAPSVAVTSSVSQCGPLPLQVKGGTPPYSVTIKKADSPDGPALKSFEGIQNPSSLQWPSGITTGMSIAFEVKDSKGLTTNSGSSTVSPSAECSRSPQAIASAKTEGDAPPSSPDAPPGAPGEVGAAKNSTAPGTEKTAGGPAGTSTPGPPTANGTASPTANTTANASQAGLPGSVNSTAAANATLPDQLDSNTTAASNESAPISSIPPSNTTHTKPPTNNGNSGKFGNSTSSVNSRPNPPKSEASRRRIGSLFLSLFIASSAGLGINLST